MKKKGKNKKRPYYAKWWFFISILTLGWLTPITKHWKVFIYSENTTGFAMRMPSKYGALVWRYIYVVNSYQYVSDYDGGYVRSHQPEVPEKTIYYNRKKPSEHFAFMPTKLYEDDNLFFPVGLQIFMGVFFLMIRLKDL